MAALGYIELIKRFWQAAKAVSSLGQCEAWVYFNLLEKANLQRWPAKIELPTRKAAAEMGMSAKKLIEVRDTLSRVGLIGYAEGDRRKSAPQYWFPGLKPGGSASAAAPTETMPNLFTEQAKDGEREQGFCFPTENKSDNKRTDFCVREESKNNADCFPTENKTIGFCLPQENKNNSDCFPTESKKDEFCFPTEIKTESKKSEIEKYCFSTENKTESKTPYSYTKVYKTKDNTPPSKGAVDMREEKIDPCCLTPEEQEEEYYQTLKSQTLRYWKRIVKEYDTENRVGWNHKAIYGMLPAFKEWCQSCHKTHTGPSDYMSHFARWIGSQANLELDAQRKAKRNQQNPFDEYENSNI